MFYRRSIAAISVLAVFSALFHIAFEHAGADLLVPCATAEPISDHPHEHDALPDEPIAVHSPANSDGHDFADHASFRSLLRRTNNPAQGQIVVTQIAYLPLPELHTVGLSYLSDTLPIRFPVGPLLFSRNRSLRL